MRTPFIAGNWKMNKTAEAAAAFANEIKDELNAIEGVDIAFCPSFLAIPAVAEAVAGTKIGVGAQNMFYEESGAYTGETAPDMITLSLIHISEPTRQPATSRMPSSA